MNLNHGIHKKNTDRKEITKLANQSCEENRWKEHCITISFKTEVEKDQKPKTYTRKNQINNDYKTALLVLKSWHNTCTTNCSHQFFKVNPPTKNENIFCENRRWESQKKLQSSAHKCSRMRSEGFSLNPGDLEVGVVLAQRCFQPQPSAMRSLSHTLKRCDKIWSGWRVGGDGCIFVLRGTRTTLEACQC